MTQNFHIFAKNFHIPRSYTDKQIFLYLKILNAWLVQADFPNLINRFEDDTWKKIAERIYHHLGSPTRLKCLYIKRLCWELSYRAFSSPVPYEERRKRWSEIASILNSSIQKERGINAEEKDVILDLMERNSSCHHAFFRHLEHIIAHIGAGKAMTLPGAGEERMRIQCTIVNYIHSLVSWLAGRTIKEALSVWPASKETVEHVYNALRKATPRERWLVACLWKKMMEGHAHCGRGEIDKDPERFACPPDALSAT
jgi:hypothetical protein